MGNRSTFYVRRRGQPPKIILTIRLLTWTLQTLSLKLVTGIVDDVLSSIHFLLYPWSFHLCNHGLPVVLTRTSIKNSKFSPQVVCVTSLATGPTDRSGTKISGYTKLPIIIQELVFPQLRDPPHTNVGRFSMLMREFKISERAGLNSKSHGRT